MIPDPVNTRVALLRTDRSHDLILQLNNWFTGFGGYGHAGLVLPDGSFITSHPEHGVYVGAIDYPPIDYDFFTVPVSAAQVPPAMAWAAGEVGSGYDFGAIGHFLLPFIAESSTRWFCSEIVVAMLQHLGALDPSIKASTVSPNGLAKLLKGLGYTKDP